MAEGLSWVIVVTSLVFLKSRAPFLVVLGCYFSFILLWFMHCSVVCAAVEGNILKWFGSVFRGFLKLVCS